MHSLNSLQVKKIFIPTLIFVFSVSIALAANTQGNGESNRGDEQGQQQDADNNEEAGNQGQVVAPAPTGVELVQEQQQVQAQQQNQNQVQVQQQVQNPEGTIGMQVQQQTRARNTEQLQTMIQEKNQEMNQELKSFDNEDKQKIYQNQNKVRAAVHTLLSAEDLIGGIGPKVSEIAQQFNNSVEKTIKAEEKIQNRNSITRFFFGGDKDAAGEIKQEANQNQERIQELKQLRDNCDCQQEVEEVISQQIQNIEQEQNRLQQLAQEQINKKGLFGWLFGWL
ncbi:hypothetical protein KKA15_01380 [Patescibacteria group bacterium]|nr:hypothetical protein [Patescibacteria group bacterium]